MKQRFWVFKRSHLEPGDGRILLAEKPTQPGKKSKGDGKQTHQFGRGLRTSPGRKVRVSVSGHEHKYDDVRGKGFFGQTRRERRAYPAVDL